MNYTTTEIIGNNLYKARLKIGLTTIDVSDYNFISKPTLIGIEKGRIQVRMIVLEELCKLYKCKSSDILPF